MWNKKDHRRYVGAKDKYDIMGATQFNILIRNGLREKHTILDIGCGSLRAGRFLIQYLAPGHYYGIEPNEWLVETAINEEIGRDLLNIKHPFFSYNGDFDFSGFRFNKFDFVIAHSIFSHAGTTQVKKCIKNVKGILNKKGKFFFTFCEGKENNKDKEWTYPGGVTYKLAFIKKILQENKLIGVKMKIKSEQTWIKAERMKNDK